MVVLASLTLPSIRQQWAANLAGVQALRAASSVAATGPDPRGDLPRTSVWAADAALARGDSTAALNLLEQAGQHAPPDTLVQLELAKVEDARGDVAQAARLWRAAGAGPIAQRAAERAIDAQDWETALTYLDAASAGAPEETVFLTAKARAALDGPLAGASTLHAALERWPESRHRQEWLARQGELLNDAQDWVTAEAVFRQALAVPDSGYLALAEIGLGRGLALGMGAIDDGRVHVLRGIEIDPASRTGYAAMGDIAASAGDAPTALRWYREALARAPGNPYILNRLADLDGTSAASR